MITSLLLLPVPWGVVIVTDTGKVPAAVYVCVGLIAFELVPSPKFQFADKIVWLVLKLKFTASPSQVLFFDDNLANINSAKSIGIDSYLIDPNRTFIQIQEILDTYVS